MLATFLDSCVLCVMHCARVSTFPDPVTQNTGLGTKMSLNHFKFVTKKAEEDMEKALSGEHSECVRNLFQRFSVNGR